MKAFSQKDLRHPIPAPGRSSAIIRDETTGIENQAIDGPRGAGAWSLEDDIASTAGLFPRGAFRLQNRVYTDSKGAPK